MRPCKDIAPDIPVNVKIAESQDEYQTIHANRAPGPYGLITFAVEMSEEEIEQFQKSGRLYVQLLTFGGSMQPIIISTDPNIAKAIVDDYACEIKVETEDVKHGRRECE
ncbi:hypothetical protein EOM57_01045 [Candidatus Saccharibacteria bacterium]|nr:hypothetical protein [Candidatus Saccharibacteria bacterium]